MPWVAAAILVAGFASARPASPPAGRWARMGRVETIRAVIRRAFLVICSSVDICAIRADKLRQFGEFFRRAPVLGRLFVPVGDTNERRFVERPAEELQSRRQ